MKVIYILDILDCHKNIIKVNSTEHIKKRMNMYRTFIYPNFNNANVKLTIYEITSDHCCHKIYKLIKRKSIKSKNYPLTVYGVNTNGSDFYMKSSRNINKLNKFFRLHNIKYIKKDIMIDHFMKNYTSKQDELEIYSKEMKILNDDHIDSSSESSYDDSE